MNNNEKVNQLLNNCRHPRAVYNALLALAKSGDVGQAQRGGGGMSPTLPPKYANKPNLWWVACELSKSKDPNKALNALMVLAGPMLELEREVCP